MELYKLYCILKRHTGYETMLESIRKTLMAEVYEERKNRAALIMAQTRLMHILAKGKAW